jgi:GMP synthase-like glutamine amidotransferase
MMSVNYNDGRVVNQLFTHQDHVIDSGEMEVIASSTHCDIVVCIHPTREIKTVQFHPEAVLSVLNYSVECGDMNKEEREEFGDGIQDLDFSASFFEDR